MLSYFCLAYKPLVFLYAVEGDEWHHDRYALYIFLVFGIIAVVLILTDFKATSTAEHNEDNADVSDSYQYPL